MLKTPLSQMARLLCHYTKNLDYPLEVRALAATDDDRGIVHHSQGIWEIPILGGLPEGYENGEVIVQNYKDCFEIRLRFYKKGNITKGGEVKTLTDLSLGEEQTIKREGGTSNVG